jgi:hypothetical protein
LKHTAADHSALSRPMSGSPRNAVRAA